MKIVDKFVTVDEQTYSPVCRVVFDTTIEVMKDGASLVDNEGFALAFGKEILHLMSITTPTNTQASVLVPKDEYGRLMSDREFLNALETAGVNNWDGYSEAMRLYKDGLEVIE